jgi:hypothetical protein
LIRGCARLFIGRAAIVFYLCAASGSVIFDSRDSRGDILNCHGWADVRQSQR